MKILISTDIEGVAGVFHSQQVQPGNGEYERARVWMTAEANNAAIAALDGGASEVIINDSHGHFRNLIADQIVDPRIRILQGKPRYLGMASGVELKPDAMFLIGYHGKAKSRGILAHTINGFAFSRVWLNERELGEAGLYGALAGEFDVPIVFASGDDVFIEETQPLFPDAVFVETKRAEGQYGGVSLSPKKSCEAIYNAVLELIRRPIEQSPFCIAAPIVCRLQTQTPALADLFEQLPIVERLDGDLIRFNAGSVQDAVRILNCFSAMSAMLR